MPDSIAWNLASGRRSGASRETPGEAAPTITSTFDKEVEITVMTGFDTT